MTDTQKNDQRKLLGGLNPREFMAQHWQKKRKLMPVSYTHLTLTTSDLV